MRFRIYATMLFALAAPAAFGAKYEGMTVTFDRPIAAVQQAAVDALTVLGVEIKKQEPTLIEGKRKNKVGFMVGSGGEILSVNLTAIDEDTTEAKVRTTKTFVGRAGQKVWDQPMVDELRKALGMAADATPAAAPVDAAAPAAAEEGAEPAAAEESAEAPSPSQE